MGVGAILEPLTVIVLLFGGTWINREISVSQHFPGSSRSSSETREPIFFLPQDEEDIDLESSADDKEALLTSRPLSPSLLIQDEKPWRERTIGSGRYKLQVITPNTAVFRFRLLSRLLHRFPFLVECWYWALVYWTYQLGRAFTAVTLKENTVDVAREHALQVVRVEQALGIFVEVDIQRFFLSHPLLMSWTNWIYSFIHIPGTIAFLVWLYYYTTIRDSPDSPKHSSMSHGIDGSPPGPPLYAARRRTLAVCNLLAFIVFTLWPCMPPRLLSDKEVPGEIGDIARSYGFEDTVHGKNGAGSVWTENRFCNQYAAMPSLHFGYSLMIGLTIMSIPLPPKYRQSKTLQGTLPRNINFRLSLPSWHRVLCVVIGVAYPLTILAAIIATANHFILDAVAGAVVCVLGWRANSILLNLLPVEDHFLWALRMHKPERRVVNIRDVPDGQSDGRIVAHSTYVN